jgi:hypothetical protein
MPLEYLAILFLLIVAVRTNMRSKAVNTVSTSAQTASELVEPATIEEYIARTYGIK